MKKRAFVIAMIYMVATTGTAGLMYKNVIAAEQTRGVSAQVAEPDGDTMNYPDKWKELIEKNATTTTADGENNSSDRNSESKNSGNSGNSNSILNGKAVWNSAKPGRTKVKKVTRKGKKAKVTLKKIYGAKGYQIKYSISKKFKKKSTKTVTTKKLTTTIKKMKSNKRYYIKARAYKLNTKGKKYYGKWSKVKTVKVSK